MITILSGTNRLGSQTLKLAVHVEETYRALGAETTLLDLTALPPELFLPESYKEKPETFAPFRDAILGAKGLVVLVPEYNGSFPGSLKYFIDMLPFPEAFEGRCVSFIGIAAGQWAGSGRSSTCRACLATGMPTSIPNAHSSRLLQLFDEEGKLLDMDAADRIERQAKGFLDFVSALKG